MVEAGGVLLQRPSSAQLHRSERTLPDIDPDMLAEPWPGRSTPSRQTARGAGLIWRQVKRYGRIYDRPLSVAEIQARIEHCWRPYPCIARLIDDTIAPPWAGVAPERAGLDGCEIGQLRGQPDFVLGDRDGTSCAPGSPPRCAGVLGKPTLIGRS
ncbi:MAG: N-formylglutamate amidohydrolase [Burkholderiaceae bacterium]